VIDALARLKLNEEFDMVTVGQRRSPEYVHGWRGYNTP
jgi:hypothetical protein